MLGFTGRGEKKGDDEEEARVGFGVPQGRGRDGARVMA